MKKIVMFLAIISICIVLSACGNNDSNKVSNNDTNASSSSQVFDESKVTYSQTDFTAQTDFKIAKSIDLEDVSYDNVSLTDKDTAQIDLKMSEDRIATLKVSKIETSFDRDLGSVSTTSINNVDVTRYASVDNITHYYWQKGGAYFDLQVKTGTAISDDEISRYIDGFTFVATSKDETSVVEKQYEELTKTSGNEKSSLSGEAENK